MVIIYNIIIYPQVITSKVNIRKPLLNKRTY